MFLLGLNPHVRNPRRSLVSSPVQSWIPFSPLALQPTVWLDAADASTITASSGLVSQWNDKSGNNFHVSNATAAIQPTTGSNTINSLNVLTFDGTGDRLSTTSVPSSSRPHAYFIVAKEAASQTTVKSMLNASAGANPVGLSFRGTSPNRTVSTFIGSFVDGPAVTTTNTNLLYFSANGASSQFGVNGIYTTVTTTGTTRDAGLRVGVSSGFDEFFNGQIAEVLYFSKPLSDRDRDSLTLYLRNKWGI